MGNPDQTVMIEKLSALIMGDEDFKALSRVQDVYCPFESLRVSRLETKHSNFLADLLNPHSSHGFGSSILKKLLENLLRAAKKPTLALKIHLDDVSNVDIRREWNHIDLLIRLPGFEKGQDLVFIIEIKVEAGESENQLSGYKDKVEKIWPDAVRLFYFLTIDGTKASDDTWISVDFERHVIAAIEEGLKESGGDPLANTMAKSYVAALRRRYIGNKDHIRIARKIWEKHRDALGYLEEKRYVKIVELKEYLSSEGFLKSINARIEESMTPFTFAYDSKTPQIDRFAIEQWDVLPGFISANWTPSKRLVLFEILTTSKGCKIELVLGKSDDPELRNRIYKVFKNKDSIPKGWSRLNTKKILDNKEMNGFFSSGNITVEELAEKITRGMLEILPTADSNLRKVMGN